MKGVETAGALDIYVLEGGVDLVERVSRCFNRVDVNVIPIDDLMISPASTAARASVAIISTRAVGGSAPMLEECQRASVMPVIWVGESEQLCELSAHGHLHVLPLDFTRAALRGLVMKLASQARSPTAAYLQPDKHRSIFPSKILRHERCGRIGNEIAIQGSCNDR